MSFQSPTSSAHARLTSAELMSLEQYARARAAFRARVLAHKRPRTLAVGPSSTWCFEDRLSVQYQIQEMLRAERIFDSAGIEAELDAYNPLIPDGTNWKVTLLLEFPEPAERAAALARLRGVEDRCYVAVAGERSYAIADEDLDRTTDVKTSAVHFLRFEVAPALRAALAAGAALALGCDHPAYRHEAVVAGASRAALLADLAG